MAKKKTYACSGITSKNKPCKLRTANKTKLCPAHENQCRREKRIFEKPEDCIVCCEKFVVNDVALSPCGHWIHKMCVFKTGKQQCPICRGFVDFNANETKIFKKYERQKKKDDAIAEEEYLTEIEEYLREADILRRQADIIRREYEVLRREYPDIIGNRQLFI